jgi:hypothetical protein
MVVCRGPTAGISRTLPLAGPGFLVLPRTYVTPAIVLNVTGWPTVAVSSAGQAPVGGLGALTLRSALGAHRLPFAAAVDFAGMASIWQILASRCDGSHRSHSLQSLSDGFDAYLAVPRDPRHFRRTRPAYPVSSKYPAPMARSSSFSARTAPSQYTAPVERVESSS